MKRKSRKESENDPEFIPGRILEMHQQGISQRDIGEALGISRSKVQRRLQSYFERGTMTRKKGSGRPRSTDKRNDRAIVREVKINPFITCREIKANNPDLNVSLDTIRRRIIESGEFKSYWAANKPYLSQDHIRRRLEWCIEHVTWSDEQWKQVLFSDESPYVLRYSGSQRVWRRHNERYILKNTKAVIKHDIKIMVWGCFSYHGVGRLYHIEGILDSKKYIRILDNEMRPSADQLFPRQNWIFQHDNDPKHASRATREYMEDYEIDVLPWPANSPDLNPIENLWSYLDYQLKGRTPNNAQELFQILYEAWLNLPQDYLQNLVSSMKRRCEAVISVRGRSTKS